MNTPSSVKTIVVLEGLFGAVCGLYGLMFLVFGFYGILHADLHRILDSLGIGIPMLAIAAGIFYTSAALVRGSRRAWRISWVIAVCVVGIGCFMLREAEWPSVPHGAHNHFGLVAGPVLLLSAFLGIILMAMPQTRRYFASESA